MSVYVVMVNDRHTEPFAFVWSTLEKAIDDARETARMSTNHPETIVEQEPPDGWLFSIEWGVEGDGAWVVERKIDEPNP